MFHLGWILAKWANLIFWWGKHGLLGEFQLGSAHTPNFKYVYFYIYIHLKYIDLWFIHRNWHFNGCVKVSMDWVWVNWAKMSTLQILVIPRKEWDSSGPWEKWVSNVSELTTRCPCRKLSPFNTQQTFFFLDYNSTYMGSQKCYNGWEWNFMIGKKAAAPWFNHLSFEYDHEM